MNKTGQQILQEAWEEFERKFIIDTNVTIKDKDSITNKRTKIINPLFHENFYPIKSFLTSTLQAFIEAEIERLEGEKEKKEDADYYIGYNQAKEETIKHLKELLETKR